MKFRLNPISLCMIGAAALLATVSTAGAQAGGGQGGLSPDTPVLAPTPPGPSSGAQPAQGPKTALPPRNTPRAQQPGQKTAAVPDPDWPCVQVKVPTMSYGQMWGGPPLDGALKSWRDDKDVGQLVDTLVARRTKIDDAKAEIAEFAKKGGDDVDKRLTMLFAGVFDNLNAQRSQIMSGIERFSKKQRDLAEAIKAETLKLAEMPQDMATQNSPEVLKEQETLNWRTRIYEERQQSVTYVCETPVILEQRAFDLGREIQAHLKQPQ